MLRQTLRLNQRPCMATMATLALLVMVALTPLVTLLLPQSMDTLATQLAILAMVAGMVLESGSVMLRPTLRLNQRPCMATMATLALLVMVALTPLVTLLLPQSMDTLATQLAILVMADTVPASGSVRLSLTPRPGMA